MAGDIEQYGLDPDLADRLAALAEEGREYWHQFDHEVRQSQWHPFVPADSDVNYFNLKEPSSKVISTSNTSQNDL